MRFEIVSVDSVIIYFGNKICENVAHDVRQAFHALKKERPPHVIEIIPSYTSILISYDFLQVGYKKICKDISEVLEHANEFYDEIATRTISIPVCYDLDLGLDLELLSKRAKMSIEDVISLHVSKKYFVYAIGFSPGFPYMGEVDDKIATPRLANPRAKVPKGSVGIADNQTAIYPQQSPGGWNILGRTPIEMFDVSYDGFSYLQVGDKVKFEAITKEKFVELGGEV